ncbi:hypothetical protein NMD26_23815 (plasmid) [Escherichia coli]
MDRTRARYQQEYRR